MKQLYSPLSVKLQSNKPAEVNFDSTKVLMYAKIDGWHIKNSDGIESSLTVEYITPSDFNWSNISSVESGTTILVKSSFNLSGATITLPINSILKFIKQGSLTNGTILTNNNYFDIKEHAIGVLNNITISGTTLLNSIIYPEWFGLNTVGYNWQPALQKSITLASSTCGQVKLGARTYQYQGNLQIPAGVTINGSSRGDTAFNSGPTKGSILYCTGPTGTTTFNRALEIVGKFVTLSNFTIKGESRYNSTIDGLVLNGVGDGVSTTSLIESVNIDNILIHSFRTGMYLVAGNNGAVTYSTFNNIRTRDCLQHIKIDVLSSNPIYNNSGSTGLPYTSPNAFINSNKWSGLYSSGNANGVLLINTQKQTAQINSQDVYLPANNLQFDGVVFEPPYAQNGHIVLSGGGAQVRMHDIRLEASQQDLRYPQNPVVYLGVGTNGNYIDLDQASVTIVDLGYNNRFLNKSSKSFIASPNSDNLYTNSSLIGLSTQSTSGITTYILPNWAIEEQCIDPNNTYAWRPLRSGSSITINYSNTQREVGYKSLSFNVPPMCQLRMYQNVDRDLHLLTNATVGGYVIANNLKDVTFTYQDSNTSIIASSASFGNSVFSGNTFEPIGGWFPIQSSTSASYYRIALFCQNTLTAITGSNISFTFTQPSLYKGTELKSSPAKYLTENGGTVYGIFGKNIVEDILPVTNSSAYTEAVGALSLPLEGNYFEVTENGFYIQKINYNTNRFPRGSEITLLFKKSGVQIINSAFISLSKSYISESGSTITLYSRYGDGIWEEINRYSKKENGYATYEISNITASTNSNYIEIPVTGEKYINLTNTASTTQTITRINYINRIPEDSRIILQFNSTNGIVSLQNSSYISLAKIGSYTPLDGDWIELFTKGDGTWNEITRKQVQSYNQTIGTSILEASNILTGIIAALPATGNNYFTITNTGATGTTRITRINDSVNKFTSGTTITLDFENLTSGITVTNSAYISLSKTGDWIPNNGDWIQLITKGDGTWVEQKRKELANQNVTMGALTIDAPTILSTGYLTLPRTGENSFTLTNTGTTAQTITRINNDSTVRFNAGSVILLDFASMTSGITLTNSSYISLAKTGNWTPSSGDWISLYTKGTGTWTELSRKQLLVPNASKGYTNGFIETYMSGNYLNLPLTGENYFGLDFTHSGATITRINNDTALRMLAGTMLTLEFNNLSFSPTFVNSGYITLSGATNYTPTSGKTITMITKGDGTWKELFRT